MVYNDANVQRTIETISRAMQATRRESGA